MPVPRCPSRPPSVSVLRELPAGTPAPFPAEPRDRSPSSAATSPALPANARAGRDWEVLRDWKYITLLFTGDCLAPKWQEYIAACAPHPAWNSVFSILPHLPRAYLLLQLQGQSRSRAWKLEFFQLRTAELPFSQQHPKLALSDNSWTSVWKWWCPEVQFGHLTEWKYLPLGILLARCWYLWMLCNT